jgi:hypothetical protein
MGLSSLVVGLLGDGVREICECRACGTTLDSCEADCPYCGPTDVVRIELSA